MHFLEANNDCDRSSMNLTGGILLTASLVLITFPYEISAAQDKPPPHPQPGLHMEVVGGHGHLHHKNNVSYKC